MPTSTPSKLFSFVCGRLEYFFQHLVYFFNALITPTRVFFQTLQNCFLQNWWKRRLQNAWVEGCFVNLLPNQSDRSIRSERHHTCEHFIKDQAQSVDVRARVDGLTFHLFRRHISGCAQSAGSKRVERVNRACK